MIFVYYGQIDVRDGAFVVVDDVNMFLAPVLMNRAATGGSPYSVNVFPARGNEPIQANIIQ